MTLKAASPTRASWVIPLGRCCVRPATCAPPARRELMVHDPDNDVDFFFLRPKDIATYVGQGTLDLGITGRDMLSIPEPPPTR